MPRATSRTSPTARASSVVAQAAQKRPSRTCPASAWSTAETGGRVSVPAARRPSASHPARQSSSDPQRARR